MFSRISCQNKIVGNKTKIFITKLFITKNIEKALIENKGFKRLKGGKE